MGAHNLDQVCKWSLKWCQFLKKSLQISWPVVDWNKQFDVFSKTISFRSWNNFQKKKEIFISLSIFIILLTIVLKKTQWNARFWSILSEFPLINKNSWKHENMSEYLFWRLVNNLSWSTNKLCRKVIQSKVEAMKCTPSTTEDGEHVEWTTEHVQPDLKTAEILSSFF